MKAGNTKVYRNLGMGWWCGYSILGIVDETKEQIR